MLGAAAAESEERGVIRVLTSPVARFQPYRLAVPPPKGVGGVPSWAPGGGSTPPPPYVLLCRAHGHPSPRPSATAFSQSHSTRTHHGCTRCESDPHGVQRVRLHELPSGD